MIRKTKGITLIALVITIIILLILAGISINMTLGKNGIITRSTEAIKLNDFDNIREKLQLAQNEYKISQSEGNTMSNEDFLISKGFIDPNTGEVLVNNIVANAKTGKGNIETLKDVYVYDSGTIYYYDENGNPKVILEIDTAGSVLGVKFEKFSTMGGQTLAIDKTGDLWSWGYNYSGQIGDGTTENKKFAQRVNIGKKVKECCASYFTSYAIDEDGNIWAWGDNSYGKVGNGSSDTNILTPTQITTGIKFKAISATSRIAAALDENGKIYGWGDNSYKQLGTSDTNHVLTPQIIDNSKTFKQISVGGDSIGGLDETGTAWVIGKKADYSAGDGNPKDSNTFVKFNTNIKKIQITSYNGIIILNNSGEIWSCGDTNYGELALDTAESVNYPTKVNIPTTCTDIQVGEGTLCVKDINGKYWTCGSNMYGTLLTGYTGELYVLEEAKILNKISNIKDVQIATCNIFYLDNDGIIHGMGYNGNGNLGNGNEENTTWSSINSFTKVMGINGDYTKIAAGERESIAIDSNGNAYTWGANWYGELGYDSKQKYMNEPTLLPNKNIKETSSGCCFSGFIDTNGNLYMCGSNYYGELGIGDSSVKDSKTLVQIKPDTKFSKISCGQSNTYAIDVDGNLWAWGENDNGELGDGTTTQRNAPVQIASGTHFKEIAAGTDCSYAIDVDGNLWSTGYNRVGSLAMGNYTSIKTLTKVPSDKKYVKLAGFHRALVIIDESGNAYTCGNNGNGQLGIGSTEKNKNTLTQVMAGTTFKACATGWDNIYLVDNDDNLWGAGENWDGELGVNPTELEKSNTFRKITNGEKVVDVASAGAHYVALCEDGNVYVCGYNEYGQATKIIIPDSCFTTVKLSK